MGSYALPYRSKEIVVDDQDDVRQAYTNGMQKVFPSLTVQKTPEPYLTLLTDQILAKYSSEKWSNSKQVVLETFPPFYGELYDVYLFVGYQENGIRKHVAFVPDDAQQSIQTLRSQGMDARPLSQLKEFIPKNDPNKKILRFHLAVRVGTNGLVQDFAPKFNQVLQKKGL